MRDIVLYTSVSAVGLLEAEIQEENGSKEGLNRGLDLESIPLEHFLCNCLFKQEKKGRRKGMSALTTRHYCSGSAFRLGESPPIP